MTNRMVIMGKPVSVNDLYTGRRFLTRDGKTIKKYMELSFMNQWKQGLLLGNVGVHIDLYYDDKKRRDIDNPIKALLDSMKNIVLKDDSQITELKITKNFGQPRVEITIYGTSI